MIKIIYILFCVFIASCSKNHYIELTNDKIKNINIPSNYTAIYCKCDNNPLLLRIVSELRMIGINVEMIDDYTKFNNIKSKNNIVIYGYSNQINGSPKNHTVTELVTHSERTYCGKHCNVTRSWNEIVVKNVTTTGISNHNNVLIYKIDENTELLMAVNSGDKYTINLSTKRKNAYIFK
jgi:hypothetical protein|tara:strand:- start:1110 stop:1646 length:537 start_codon:yes stop_codon:yes gene_type:complete